MEIFESIILAVIQGLSEFLPISSSGHLTLAQHIFGTDLHSRISLDIILHIGTLVSVCIAFHKLIISLIIEFGVMLRDIFTGKFSFKNRSPQRNMIFMLFVACLPLIPVYPFKDFFEIVKEEKFIVILGICFLITSVLLFLSDRCVKGRKEIGDIKVRNAVSVGVFQVFALLPGISRSGATISSGLFCGFNRKTAVQFSFLLSMPAILGGALSHVSELKESASNSIGIFPMVIGFVVSAIVGLMAIKLVSWLIKTDRFSIFAIYTAIVGIITIIYGII